MLSADQWREYAAQIEAVSDVPGYPFPVGPSAEDCLQMAALIGAAQLAWELVALPEHEQSDYADAYASVAADFNALLPQTGEGEGADRADPSLAEAENLNRTAIEKLRGQTEAASDTDRVMADIAAERRRQVEVEGFTTDHDGCWPYGELAEAAACYASGKPLFLESRTRRPSSMNPDGDLVVRYAPIWPWAEEWWKPKTRRHNLVRAGALITAEIERIDRGDALSKREGG